MNIFSSCKGLITLCHEVFRGRMWLACSSKLEKTLITPPRTRKYLGMDSFICDFSFEVFPQHNLIRPTFCSKHTAPMGLQEADALEGTNTKKQTTSCSSSSLNHSFIMLKSRLLIDVF